MKKVLHILFFCFGHIAIISSYAQGEDNLKKIFPVAEQHLAAGKIDMALKNFLELEKLYPDNAHVKYKIGLCYLATTNRRSLAISYFKAASKNISIEFEEGTYKDEKAPPDAIYKLAKSYHIEFKIDSAIIEYKKFKEQIPDYEVDLLKDVDRQIQMCNNAREIFKAPVAFSIQNIGNKINSAFDDYSAVLDASESILIFTSRRQNTTGNLKADDGKYFEDVYSSIKNSNGEWSVPSNIGPAINTEGHDACLSLSADGQQLYIYRDDWGNGNIYVSKLENDIWSEAVLLGSDINSKDWETHASVSPDGQLLFFTSDRIGGKGGLDIYVCKKLPNGEWGLAQRLSDTVNSEYDEDAPFMHPDGKTLFFSSKGHTSIGGFDIFFTVFQEDGKWSQPKNIGYPTNTADDEIFFVASPDGKRAYYSSSKDRGFGEKDIYLINLELEIQEPLTLYKGRIEKDENGSIPKVAINVTDNKSGELYGTFRNRADNGNFTLILKPGISYNIAYEANGYLFHSENFTVPVGTSYFEINKAVILEPMKVKKK
jgi:tetratricopeptide (TPR) repeat protein